MKSSDVSIRKVLECLRVAGSRVSEEYIRIPTADSKHLTDERTYCYELYHQLRKCLTDQFSFTLMGELGKAPPLLTRRVRPDFLIHVPGSSGETGGNLMAIEVKPLGQTTPGKLRKDIDKLVEFVTRAGYVLGILLIYDHECGKFPKRRHTQLKEIVAGHGERLVVAWHSGPGKEIELVVVPASIEHPIVPPPPEDADNADH
jgi:hypothetical protein